MSIRVLIADDHEILRYGLRCLIEDQPDMEVVGEAENGRQAIELVEHCKPDVVIMDISMPNMNGIEASRKIKKLSPDTKVVVLSMYRETQLVIDMIEVGVSGYILKDNVNDVIIRAIRGVVKGEVFLCPKIAGVVTEYLSATKESRKSALTVLSPREREVLQLIAEGNSTKKIAMDLYVSVKAVESTRRKIMQKLDLHSVAELTKYAIREHISSLEF